MELSSENGKQMWIPPGFLHGFVTREPDTEIIYKCTDHYDPACDGAVRWDSLGIDWGMSDMPEISEKDAKALPFSVRVAFRRQLIVRGGPVFADRSAISRS